MLSVYYDRGAATFAANLDSSTPNFVVSDRVFGATCLAGYLHRGATLANSA